MRNLTFLFALILMPMQSILAKEWDKQTYAAIESNVQKTVIEPHRFISITRYGAKSDATAASKKPHKRLYIIAQSAAEAKSLCQQASISSQEPSC